MNGQTPPEFSPDGYTVVDMPSQYFIYPDLKLQEQLAKQTYAAPITPPEHFPQDTIVGNLTPGMGSFVGEEQAYPELVDGFATDTTVLHSRWGMANGIYDLIESKGPLVGELKSTRDLALEYAGADPIYVAKTSSLYPTYNLYRKIRGDGNCAWRAIAFGYFELLIRSGNADFINREWARLMSLENLLKKAGFAEYIYEDFAAEAFDVFRMISSSPVNDEYTTISELVRIFNQTSDSIIMYFKLLTSAWMKTRASDYEAYLELPSVQAYCQSAIEPFSVELDHVGVKALIDCLILPADLRVEISYLDRSPGTEVNIHHFENSECSYGQTLRLLYRPGHYDIIYKTGEMREPTAFIDKVPQASLVQVSFMPQLPEQCFSSTPLNYFLNQAGNSGSVERRNEDRDKFRASLFQYPPFQPSPLPFQTSIFRNSAFNPSHYQSENFQPELYQPDLGTATSERSHGRRRS